MEIEEITTVTTSVESEKEFPPQIREEGPFVPLSFFRSVETEIFKDKSPPKKLFVITYGPQASGKGAIVETILLPHFKISFESMVEINIDSIVNMNPRYKERIAETDSPEGRQYVYFKFRRLLDDLSDAMLAKALSLGLDIFWETTGNTIAWTIQTIDMVKRLGYTTVIAYPLVDVDQLILRARKRGLLTGQVFDEDRIRKNVISAQNNLPLLVEYVDEVVLIDNRFAFEEMKVALHIKNKWLWTQEYGWQHTDPKTFFYGPGRIGEFLLDSCDKKEFLEKAIGEKMMTFLRSLCEQREKKKTRK